MSEVETLIISTLPREPLSDEQLGLLITSGLAQRLEALTDVPSDGLLSQTQYRMLDDLIIRQTETLGEFALASPMVRERLHAWRVHPSGIFLTERFAAALVKAVRYHQRVALPPLDPGIPVAKRKTVDELRAAFKILRAKYSTAKKKPRIAEVVAQFQGVVQDGGFSHLGANIDSWNSFFRARSEFVLEMLNRPRLSPAALYDAWLAWATHYEQETLRQKISSLNL